VTDRAVAAAWDAEYAAGRYLGEAPVLFVRDILRAARDARLTSGLYAGCGNGRNYLPLTAGGLDLTGLDVSAAALAQLASGLAERSGSRLICGDLSCLAASAAFPLVIGIQVFQHGDRATAHGQLGRAAGHVAPGGLLCVRVNAAATDVWPAHEITERHADGGFTVRYLAGAKRGLQVHFFGEAELAGLVAAGFAPVLALRLSRTRRVPPAPGQWSQWEAIWRRVC
jgi:SAM-dependent methyltransferase